MANVAERLRDGVPSGPLFDRDSRAAYALALSAALVGAVLFIVQGFKFAPDLGIGPPLWAALILPAGWLARRVGHTNIATGLETTAFVYLQGFAFLLIIYSVMAMPFPMVDQHLAAADRMLGFYWPDLAAPFRRSPDLTAGGKIIYKSFIWQPALVTVALAITGLHRRAWQFVTAAVISLWITAIIGSVLPADTPVVFFHYPPWSELVSAWRPSEIIHALKAGDRFIDQKMMAGLITAPSYHATAAAMFAWALYPIRLLRWPAIVLCALVLPCTVVIGSHYVVDIFAGVIVAVVAIVLAGRIGAP